MFRKRNLTFGFNLFPSFLGEEKSLLDAEEEKKKKVDIKSKSMGQSQYLTYHERYGYDDVFKKGVTITNKDKQNRNDYCNCGSGLKYKKCCINKK